MSLFDNTCVAASIWIWLYLLTEWRKACITAATYRRAQSLPEIADDDLPKVAVFIGLRGADPSLRDALISFLNQDYPDYKVFVVIDSESDPAWEVLRELETMDTERRLDVRVLTDKHATCSLRTSALLQTIRGLDSSFEVVAAADSDAPFASDWLQRLVRPFQDADVAVVTGIRWFAPTAGGLGTLVRYFWNVSCVTVMCTHGMPWGGCMALHRRYVDDSALLETLQHSLVDDIPSGQWAHDDGWKVGFAPIVGVSHERIRLADFVTFGRRQLIYARLYHDAWRPIFISVVGSIIAPNLLVAGVIYHWFTQQWMLWAMECLTVAGYWLVFSTIQRRLESIFGSHRSFAAGQLWQWPLAGILTQWLAAEFVLMAPLRKRIFWRGIEYRIGPGKRVRMVEYRPYENRSEGSSESLI